MKYILFDLDGTLMNFTQGEKRAFIQTVEKVTGHTPTEEECTLFSDINERLFNSFARGEMKRIEFQERRFKEIAEYMEVLGEPSSFNKVYQETIKLQADLYSDVLPILDYLKGKYKLFIASNGVNRVQQKRLEIAQISSYFDDVFVSEVIGANKPDLAFFTYIFKSIGDKDLNQYVIIGDRLDADVQGGLSAGINAIYLSRDKKEPNSIQSLMELKEIL